MSDDRLVQIAEQLGRTSAMVEDLHRSLYQNGFRKDVSDIKDWVHQFEKDRLTTCPAYEAVRHSMDRRKKAAIRRMDVILGVGMLVVTVLIGVPAWLAYLGG